MTADQLQLITAAVDGELSATEARAFRTLVASSPEARALYEKLKADSARVRALTPVAPPADLHAKILARLATVTPPPRVKPKPLATPAPAKTAEPLRRLPTWMPAAIAASVLLCISAGSFAFFTQQGASPQSVAKTYWTNTLPAAQDSQPTVPSPTASAVERPDPASVVRVAVSPVPPVPAPRAVTPEAMAVAPEPRSLSPDFHASGVFPALPPFDRVQVRVPFLRPVADLDRDDIRQELLDELRRGDPAFKFDLFVRDTARGAEVFQAAAKTAGLTLFADAATLEKLKKRQPQPVVVYTESLTAAELAALFAALATEDAKFSPRVCDSLHATTITKSDETELKAVLGLDVGLFKRPTSSVGTAGQGEPKSVSAGTIDSVVKSVSQKPGEKVAVLLPWQLHTNGPRTNPAPPTSAELKQFLAKRGDRKPNAVPAIIVIRSVG